MINAFYPPKEKEKTKKDKENAEKFHTNSYTHEGNYAHGITLRLCLVHLHICSSNFSILTYKLSLYMLISKDNQHIRVQQHQISSKLICRKLKIGGF